MNLYEVFRIDDDEKEDVTTKKSYYTLVELAVGLVRDFDCDDENAIKISNYCLKGGSYIDYDIVVKCKER